MDRENSNGGTYQEDLHRKGVVGLLIGQNGEHTFHPSTDILAVYNINKKLVMVRSEAKSLTVYPTDEVDITWVYRNGFYRLRSNDPIGFVYPDHTGHPAKSWPYWKFLAFEEERRAEFLDYLQRRAAYLQDYHDSDAIINAVPIGDPYFTPNLN